MTRETPVARALTRWWHHEGTSLRNRLVKAELRGSLPSEAGRMLAMMIGAAFRAGWLARERMGEAEGQPVAMYPEPPGPDLPLPRRTVSSRVVLVTGGRDYQPNRGDAWWLRGVLDALGTQTVRHGGARGVDEWAGKLAGRLGLQVDEVQAEWGKLGKRAGVERNERMLQPDVVGVVAFPGGKGTQHMVELARARSHLVVEHHGRRAG